MTRPWTLPACFLAASVLFFFANRGAYKAYFADDDLDNLGWPTFVGNDVYLKGLATLRFDPNNFRPIGDLYYRYAYRAFHLRFPPYVVVLQIIHGLNVVLLFLILRRLGSSALVAGAGALFYSFHAATLETYWKPMYVFDLLCATFCLLALALYIRGRWILAFIAFWLALKSKELALMLPVVLVAYEWLLGKREWKKLIPFFAISIVIGAQVLWFNRTVDPGNAYALRFDPGSLWQAIAFYASRVFFLPYLGLALLLPLIWIRDRVLYFGLISMAAWIAPLLLLPQRMDTAYWYVPLIGVAIAVTSIAARLPRWAVALTFALWLPLNFLLMREKRRAIIAGGDRDRAMLAAVGEYARTVPPVRTVVFDNMPDRIHVWGVQGAISLSFGQAVESAWTGMPESKELLTRVPMALIHFRPDFAVRGMVRTRAGAQAYVRFDGPVPAEQFGEGWRERYDDSRWIEQRAACIFYRPAFATDFEMVARIFGRTDITVIEDGRTLGTLTAPSGVQTLRWKLPPADAGEKHISIRSGGLTVKALGYIPH